MSTPLSRRRFLQASAGTAGAVLLGRQLGGAEAVEPDAAFGHGAASGDPEPDGVVIWTRYTDGGSLTWEVAPDPAFVTLAGTGTVSAVAERDWCVHVDVRALIPATTYWYRFRATDGSTSPIGRTRTAPAGAAPRVRLAVVSCSSYAAGFFNPYARLGLRNDLDAVVHVGDYFYETGTPGVRPHDPPHELVNLADYRRRYAQYRSDPALQLAHGAHPWIMVWDDHESANDAWSTGAHGHQASEGSWLVRRAAAVQAWREWQPVRWPDLADDLRIWRRLQFGDLVDLFMLDTRLYGRTPGSTPTGTRDIGSNSPERTMLGSTQKQWLMDGLSSSTARWRLFGNQTMISPHRNDPANPPLPYLPPAVIAELGLLRQGGGNEGGDNWGAYHVERDELIRFLRDRRIANNVFLTGDIHSAWAADIVEDAYTPYHRSALLGTTPGYDRVTGLGSVGVEMVCTSVTSNNFADSVDPLAPVLVAAFNTAIEAGNPNVAYCDVGGHGYTVIDVDQERVRGEWWETGTAHQDSSQQPETLVAVVESRHGRAGFPGTDHARRRRLQHL